MPASAQPWRRQPRYERLVSGERITVSEGDRTCAHPDCETRLSRYNPDGTCSRHGGWTDESVPHRGRKPAQRLSPEPPGVNGSAAPNGSATVKGSAALNGSATVNGSAALNRSATANGPAGRPAPGVAPRTTVRAEIYLEPVSGANGRAVPEERFLELLEGTGARVERRDLSAFVTGEPHAVLRAVEHVHRSVAPTAGRLVTNLRLETWRAAQ